MDQNNSQKKTSKIERIIRKYELDGMGERLETYWTDEGDEQRSLRNLADFFNQEVLRVELDQQNASLLEGEIENTYRLLTDETVSSGVRTETENSLARDGIDVEQLEKDFVSHQAIYTYLTKYREVSHESKADDAQTQVEKGADTIRRLQNRAIAVAETTLTNLRNTDRIELADFDVISDIRVVCNECGQSYSIDDLFDSGGCECMR
ncbi:rod-determining factor RdfA [Haladaptatus cibarius]|uniref:rod-determining factor RdfA n=1 Tax=Haladaptatus cibarius TaxID=453847 RepID=UPI000679E9C2|nr:rod-determining factor RdfA [Haladaptatus cibarius]